MPKCRKCGDNTYSANKGICRACRKLWLDSRLEKWNKVVDEFGQPTKDNLEAMKKAMKEK